MKKYFLIAIIAIMGILQMDSQCFPNRHSTNWFDGWVSCETSSNPNSVYGDSHWILYDFGYNYTLYGTKFWNINEPENLDYGVMNYDIDYSNDGITWLNLGNFTLNQATGLSTYEGELGPDFEGTSVRYVLITPTTNYGGDCYGLSEVKFYLDESAAIPDEEIGLSAIVYPNPFDETITIRIGAFNSEKPMTYTIYDILGSVISQKTLKRTIENNVIDLAKNNLTNGIYFIKIEHNDKQETVKIIKE